MEISFENILIAFSFTLIAGLSTGIGSTMAFFMKRTSKKFLSISLGFSAGVMIYVSLVEIFVQAKDILVLEHGPAPGYWYTLLAFFGGMLLIAIIDRIIPSPDNPHEIKNIEDTVNNYSAHNRKLMRIGLFTALAIAIHNFPEGIATFTAGLADPTIALPIMLAIAIHNIPEGIAVSVPIFFATGSRRKAFFWSFLSGLSEPLGAVIGYALLFSFLNNTVFGFMFGSVAGIMVFISLDELLPSARKYGEHHLSIYGLVAGMLIMAVSLVLFS